jgi:hypothetical protein
LPDTTTWLSELGLEKYVAGFLVNEVDLAALSHLTDDDLKELGLPLGPRRKVLAALCETANASVPSQLLEAHPVGDRRVVAVLFVELARGRILGRRRA